MTDTTPFTPLTVGQLREQLAGLDADLPVYIESCCGFEPVTGAFDYDPSPEAVVDPFPMAVLSVPFQTADGGWIGTTPGTVDEHERELEFSQEELAELADEIGLLLPE
jgi:hypothetical protein